MPQRGTLESASAGVLGEMASGSRKSSAARRRRGGGDGGAGRM